MRVTVSQSSVRLSGRAIFNCVEISQILFGFVLLRRAIGSETCANLSTNQTQNENFVIRVFPRFFAVCLVLR